MTSSAFYAFRRSQRQGLRLFTQLVHPYPTSHRAASIIDSSSLQQRDLCSTSSTGGNFDTNEKDVPLEDIHISEPLQFPDPLDPLEHPLATLSEEDLQERQEHWEKVKVNSQPIVYKQKLNEDGRAYAIGSRKRSKAKVWIGHGNGKVTVNGRPWVEYFGRIDHRDKILRPFSLTGLIGKMNLTCEVQGGGSTGQAEAVRHAVSRALQNWDPLFRPTLKADGLLTRDSREVESKKYGRKKARKSFQWVKR